MSAADQVRKNFNIFVDGRGFAGQAQNFRAPVLTVKAEEFKAGGMIAPIDIKTGLEKLTSGFNLFKYSADVLALFGVANGQTVSFTAREVLEDFDGTITPVVHYMRGRILSMDAGETSTEGVPTLNVEMSLTYYKLQHGSRTIHDIDPLNGKHIVDGTDVYAEQRAALGM